MTKEDAGKLPDLGRSHAPQITCIFRGGRNSRRLVEPLLPGASSLLLICDCLYIPQRSHQRVPVLYPRTLLVLVPPFLGNMRLFLPLSLLVLPFAYCQTCENYGTLSGDGCSCPTGFGGAACSQPGCHGTIFEGAQRQFAPASDSGPANLTTAGCGCESGWIGTGCNVCQTASACQSAFATTGSGTPDIENAPDPRNNTMVCNSEARVWAAGQMSCQVIVSEVFLCIYRR